MAKNRNTKRKTTQQMQTVKAKREGFRNFISGVKVELLHRVLWPKWKEMKSYSITVVGFILFWALYIGLWDFIFAKGMEALVTK
ncbi:MAG: preprotein translocase subunit SecE [Caldisericaceae bacterium]|nr:preprotein translocase subunit SecE [Caldisericaceae bacterium]